MLEFLIIIAVIPIIIVILCILVWKRYSKILRPETGSQYTQGPIMRHCSKCGGRYVDHGVVESIGYPSAVHHYQSHKWKRRSGEVLVYANVCLNCGYIEQYVDPRIVHQRMMNTFRM